MRVTLHETTRSLRDAKPDPKHGRRAVNLPEVLFLPVFQSPFWTSSEWNASLNLER
jgi:hypothetical protein